MDEQARHRRESDSIVRRRNSNQDIQQVPELGEEAESEDKENFVSIYVSTLIALAGAVVIFANRFTKEECFGIQEGFVHLAIVAGPQALLIFLFVVGAAVVLIIRKFCAKERNEDRRSLTGHANQIESVAVDHPTIVERLVFVIVYTLLAAATFISYFVDTIVVGRCISFNDTIAANNSMFGIKSILVRSITSSAIVWFCWFFFLFALFRKAFQKPSWKRTVVLGGLLVVHTLMWISSFIQEASEVNNIFYWIENCTEWYPRGHCMLERNYFRNWKPWLYPSVVEYCLVTVSMTLRLWHSGHRFSGSYSNILELEQEEQSVKQEWKEHTSRGKVVGISLGVFILSGYIAASSLMVHWQSPPNEDKDALSATVVVFLYLSIVTDLLFIACFLVTFWVTRDVGKCRMSLEVEDYLTLATGLSVQIIASLIITSDSFNVFQKPVNIKIILSLIKESLDFIQGILQTLMFVLLKRVRVKNIPNYPCKRPLFFMAISISMAISLIFCLWSIIFEGQVSNSIYSNQVDVFGASRWRTILVILYPLAIFYQLHCFWSFLRFIEMVRSTGRR
jgi:hypothetical protein